MTMYDAMRISDGMNFLSREMNTFEQISTTVTASPIPRAFVTDVVTARVEHIPSIWTRTGFLFMMPSAA